MRVLQLRRRTTGRGVTLPPQRLRFSADGGILAACYDTPVGWTAIETHSGLPNPLLPEDRGRLSCTAYSGNGEYVAVGSVDGAARVYRTDDGSRLAALNVGRPHIGVTDLMFAPTADPKGQWLAACGDEFWLWHPITQQYHVAPDPGVYRSITFEPHSRTVLVTCYNEVICFTIRPFAEIWRFKPVGSTAMFPVLVRASSGLASLTVSTDGLTLFRISVKDGVEQLRTHLAARPRDLAFFPNSRLLAVADGSPTLKVYDTDTGTFAREYDWGIGGIHCVTFSNDGTLGAVGGDKGQVVVWDLD